MFIAFLYMFPATMCQSSGENTVPMRHLVLVTLYCIGDCLVCTASCVLDNHLHRVTNTRRCIGTVFPPDDGHIVARNMYRKAINIVRKFVDQVGSLYKTIQGFTVNKTQNNETVNWKRKRQLANIWYCTGMCC